MAKQITIVSPKNASWSEKVAAREVRRYVFLTTGKLLTIHSEDGPPQTGDAIIVARKDQPLAKAFATNTQTESVLTALAPQGYLLKTFEDHKRRILLLEGGDDAGTLYAAYRLAEILGVRFYLHGDVIPDERVSLVLPQIDERSKPLFALRGIQPFHDFPEGPDWWNKDDYLAVLAQLPKLRMNFIGLHTYPEGHPNAEPTVWIGLPEDADKTGRVKFSYPASYANTLRGNSGRNWGYTNIVTGEFVCGSGELFERDDFGPEPMLGFCPEPNTAQANNEVFQRTTATLREAFQFAHQLGIKTCVGTETPLTVPKLIKEHLATLGKDPTNAAVVQELYEGVFERAAKAYPLDYFWFWTPEGWTWQGVNSTGVIATTNDLFTAMAAHKKINPPFQLATCGWVLGPQNDRALFGKILPKDIAVSCINRQVGKTPIDPAFAQFSGRSKWAIPWLEDDGALTSAELWAGRMRRDACDALAYGCDGLLGIHWRTRILSPNIGALAQAAWSQAGWCEPGSAGKFSETNFPPIADYYADWAQHEFGKEISADAARIFTKIDGHLPRPTEWHNGPGNLVCDKRAWEEISKDYRFADEFAALASRVKGRGARERFDYWLNNFQYMNSMARLGSTWNDCNRVIEEIKKETDATKQKQVTREKVLPLLEKMTHETEIVFEHLLATVSTPGELGTVANWNEHVLPEIRSKLRPTVEKLLGEPLPALLEPEKNYHGPARVIVPAKRTSVNPGEQLNLKVLVLAEEAPRGANLFWRKLGGSHFKSIPLQQIARGVYSARLPAAKDDLEYYVKIEPRNGRPVYFPDTAPQLNQTVILLPPTEVPGQPLR